MAPSSIAESIAGGCIFLTGVTGFVGGCLLERICRMDPGPAHVFVLVRGKHLIEPKSRLKKILASPLFASIPPRKLEHVEAITGDVDCENLGLNEADITLLSESCTHVFHVAAFISFAAQLDQAIRVNLHGTRAVLTLARSMRKLKAMVHVSTAYANCTFGKEHASFDEIIYPVNVDPLQILNAVNTISLKKLEEKYDRSIGIYPNTYSFTKRLSENLLAQERGNVPLAIVRPGIILNSWREPFPGWVDNVNSGACGFIAGAVKGIFCTFQGCNDMIMDVIPVDMVVSTILAASLKVEQEPQRVHIFHCTSGTVNPTTWGKYCNGIISASKKYPCKGAAWYPRAKLRESRIRNELVILIFHMLPGYLIDLFAKITKPGYKVFELQRRFAKGNKYTSYFSMHQWQFTRIFADELIQMLPEEERDIHPMDPRLINWNDYFEACVLGTRSYFHKEPFKTTKEAVRRMTVLRGIAILVPLITFIIASSVLIFILGIAWIVAVPIALIFVIILIWL